MTLHLKMAATGCSLIKSIEVREAMNQATVNVEVTCAAHSLSIGDSVDVAMGTDANYATMLQGGIVKKILTRVPDFDYVITIQDRLSRAVDYFIASDDPNAPYAASNIKAEDLVVYLLGLAGLTGVLASPTIFTYGTVAPVPINLLSAWSMVDTISSVCGFTTYCDSTGVIHFVERKPYVTASDTVSTHSYVTGDGGDILSVEYDRNVENLINRVVVYGGVGNSVHATASAVSPYLPSGFFKTTVVAHPLIDNQTAAQATADLNLEMFNRLTETVSLNAAGNPNVRIRQIVDVTEGFVNLDASTLWLIYGMQHTCSLAEGFSQKLTLVK